MSAAGDRRRYLLDLTPLRTSRDFRLLFAASGVSGFGSFITYVTVPYQVARLTDDPLLVGLLGVAELVPLLVMAFVGGALADYLDRRLLVLSGEVAFTGLTGLLLVNAFSDTPHLWLLYVVAGLTAAIDGVQRPALEGLVPRLVTPQEIPAASALSSLRMQLAALGGPSLAGVLIATTGVAWVYAIDLATFAFSLACLAAMRRVPPPPAADRPSLRSVAAGLRYAGSRQSCSAPTWWTSTRICSRSRRRSTRSWPTGSAGRRSSACSTPPPRSVRCWPPRAPGGPRRSTGTA